MSASDSVDSPFYCTEWRPHCFRNPSDKVCCEGTLARFSKLDREHFFSILFRHCPKSVEPAEISFVGGRTRIVKFMRTVLICHAQAPLDRYGLTRWLASFSEFAGVIVLQEKNQRIWRRIRREIQRTGPFRFLDVLGFRAYYQFFHSRRDARWERAELAKLFRRFPEVSPQSRVLFTHSPNSPEAESFLREARPDMVIARCKTLLKERIFSLPSAGTFVFHPGICPEYRNAHGCFWALANGDLEKVGMTLLRIDSGVDTGPIYGHFSYGYDEVRESHHVIQQRAVFDNLDKLQARLLDIYADRIEALDVRGRSSQTWGQPWLSRYLAWKHAARERQRNASHLDSVSRRGE